MLHNKNAKVWKDKQNYTPTLKIEEWVVFSFFQDKNKVIASSPAPSG
jgi:hypothetical protein